MWQLPLGWHHQQQQPKDEPPEQVEHLFSPWQQTGGVTAAAFSWAASVLAAAAPMTTAPSRARKPPRSIVSADRRTVVLSETMAILRSVRRGVSEG